MSKVYLIEKAWVDPTEKHPSLAFGYSPVGFVQTLEEAQKFVEEGGLAPRYWATPNNARMFRFTLLVEIVIYENPRPVVDSLSLPIRRDFWVNRETE